MKVKKIEMENQQLLYLINTLKSQNKELIDKIKILIKNEEN